MPLSNEQIEKIANLFQSKEEADHNMAQSLVESLCKTQDDFESIFLRHKRHLNGGMPSFFGQSIVWAYGFYAQFEASPIRDWYEINLRGYQLETLPDYLLTLPNLEWIDWEIYKGRTEKWLETTDEDALQWICLLSGEEASSITVETLVIIFSDPRRLIWAFEMFAPYNQNVANLTHLDLSDNDFTILPESIGQLTKLTELNLGDNKLTSLPKSIFTLPDLTLIKMPTEWLSLSWLETLEENTLHFIQLICGESAENVSVDVIEYKFNGNSFVWTLGYLAPLNPFVAKVRTLKLWRMDLTCLPDNIGNLTNLTELSSYDNPICRLPDSILNLRFLTVLRIRDNNLTCLPDQIGKLIYLTELDLGVQFRSERNNELTYLPDSIGELPMLSQLNLQHNQLTCLPDTIGDLKRLKYLHVADNKLTCLPDTIGQLRNLDLRIRDNLLTTLPDSYIEIQPDRIYMFGNRVTFEERQRLRSLVHGTIYF